MLEGFDPIRYSIINEKNKREIVMLRGRGCVWRRCRFCDYHLDFDRSEEENFALNKEQLDKVTGIHKKLEVINSGSFIDLDEATMGAIHQVCRDKEIQEVHFECHYMHRKSIPTLREKFSTDGIAVKVKLGVETFDYLFRESYLDKGINESDPAIIAQYFDECCLLQGIPGQTMETMCRDIEIGLEHFERVCINIMQNNGKPVKADPSVIEAFIQGVYPVYKDDGRVDILIENTAFGVGGVTTK